MITPLNVTFLNNVAIFICHQLLNNEDIGKNLLSLKPFKDGGTVFVNLKGIPYALWCSEFCA